MPNAKRKVLGKMQCGNARCADDVKAHTARHVHLEQMWAAFGLKVEESNGAACMLRSSIGSGYRPVSA
jgi:hypothetical protein